MLLSSIIISFGLIFPILLIAIVCAFWFFWKLIISKDIPKNKIGLVFLEIDLKKWRIRKKTSNWNSEFNSNDSIMNISKLFDSGWIDLSTFLKKFNADQQGKWKKSIEYCYQNQLSTSFDIDFKMEKSQYQNSWNVNFSYSNQNKINVYIKWNNKTKTNNTYYKIIAKKELLNNIQYKMFVAFSLIDSKNDTIQAFIKALDQNLKIKKMEYFKSLNMLIVIVNAKKYSKLQPIKNKILDVLKKLKNKSIVDNYYNAVAFVEAKNITTESDFAKIMTRISFGLIKSKFKQEPFTFNLKSIFFNEFEEYKETIANLNQLIQDKKIEIEWIDVKKISNDKKVFTYLYPKWQLNDNIWLNSILQTNNFKNKIHDIFFNKVMKEIDGNKENIMIDVNQKDIEKSFDKIMNKNKLIYLFQIDNELNVSQLISLLNLFKKHNINFGFKIHELTSNILSVIENIKPKVIVLNDQFNNYIVKENAQTKLIKMEIIIMCERLHIIPIFENITSKNKRKIQTIEKIEKYYYNRVDVL